MKIGIVVFPGSNCDKDCHYAVNTIMGQSGFFIWHQDHDIPSGTDMIILPGGFSYGDYLRCGSIATFSPIMDNVKEFAAKGKPVMGICNGFQILTESGLLPGALVRNDNLKFVCDDVFLSVANPDTAFTRGIAKNSVLKIPIAHGEGNYFIEDGGMKELKKNNQIVFQYCSPEGKISSQTNPNGSLENIAGIINKNGNVLGMMPHPERAVEKALYSEDGIKIFEAIIRNF